ncbi:unnamed protein product, partial [Linum tenue]
KKFPQKFSSSFFWNSSSPKISQPSPKQLLFSLKIPICRRITPGAGAGPNSDSSFPKTLSAFGNSQTISSCGRLRNPLRLCNSQTLCLSCRSLFLPNPPRLWKLPNPLIIMVVEWVTLYPVDGVKSLESSSSRV